MLRDANGQLYRLNAESPDNTRWDAESAVEVPLRLDFTAVPPGEYTLCIGLYEGPTAIRLAIRSEQKNPDGSYHLESFSVDP